MRCLALAGLSLLAAPAQLIAQSEAVDLPAGYTLASAYVDDDGGGLLALIAPDGVGGATSAAFMSLADPHGELMVLSGMLDYYGVRHLADTRFLLRGIGNPPRDSGSMDRDYSEAVLVVVGRRGAEIITEKPIPVYVDYETIQRPSRDGKYWIESDRYVWPSGERRPRPINGEVVGAGVRFSVHSLETGELERTLYVEFPGLELSRNPVFEVIESEGRVLALSLRGVVHVLRFGDWSLSSEYLSLPAAAPACRRLLGLLARWQPSERRLWVRGGTSSRWQRDWVAFDLWSAGLNRVSPVFPEWRMTGSDMWSDGRHADVGALGERRFVYPHPDRGVVAVRREEQRYQVQYSWRDFRVPGVFEVQSSDWMPGSPIVTSDEGLDVWVSANGRYAVVQEENWTWDDEESRPEWVAERLREGQGRYIVRRIELHRTYAKTDPLGQPVEPPVGIRRAGPDEEPPSDEDRVGRLGGVEGTGTGKSKTNLKGQQREGTYTPAGRMEAVSSADCGVVGPRLVWVEN